MSSSGPAHVSDGALDGDNALLITITGPDRPGVTTRMCSALAGFGARIADIEQVVLRDHLILGVVVHLQQAPEHLRRAVTAVATEAGMQCEFETVEVRRMDRRDPGDRHHVTILGMPLPPDAIAGITATIARLGGNIERIDRLSRYPILSFELVVSRITDTEELKRALGIAAAQQRVDVAVQKAGLHRRAKRLIVFDVDSTLVDGEVIELLAEHAGCAKEVAAITAAAMRGEIDFEQSLRQRVALLAGIPEESLTHVHAHLRLNPGARTVMRTLTRLGYVTAIVSGGFSQVTDDLAADLGVTYSRANTLEIVNGRLTGGLVGPIVDRAAKADHLRTIAKEVGVPLSQTVAVGDGANDLDMLAAAGLGIAYNAKRIVREQAEVTVNVPYLDAVLFVLGITREEIERADADDPHINLPEPPAVPYA